MDNMTGKQPPAEHLLYKQDIIERLHEAAYDNDLRESFGEHYWGWNLYESIAFTARLIDAEGMKRLIYAIHHEHRQQPFPWNVPVIDGSEPEEDGSLRWN